MIFSGLRAASPLLAGALVLGCGLGVGADEAVSRQASPPAPAPAVPAPAHTAAPAQAAPPPPAPAPAETPAQPPPPAPAPSPSPADLPPVRSSAPGTGKTVALTFDDGPGPSTQAIIDVLKKYNVPATFFNIGQQEATHALLVREEAENHYALGNHTWDHADLTTLGPAGQAQEIARAQQETRRVAGVTSAAFRPPYGAYDRATRQAAADQGLSVWTWNVDTLDWKHSGHYSAADVAEIVQLAEAEGVQQSHPVILMHNPLAGTPSTVAALPQIIEFFLAHGYTFVTL